MSISLILKGELRHSKIFLCAVGFVLALAFSLSISSLMIERTIKASTTKASDHFDLIIGSKGSPTSLLLGSVYLQEESLSLVPAKTLESLSKEKGVLWSAPIALGDRVGDSPLVGTTRTMITFGGQIRLKEGREFMNTNEAVVGSLSGYRVGDPIYAHHGRIPGTGHAHDEAGAIKVVGVLEATGTPWDKAVLVPIEWVWSTHQQYPKDQLLESWMNSDLSQLPGFSALIVKPEKISDAYKLRQRYAQKSFEDHKGNPVNLMAIFTGEVLVSLYGMFDIATNALSIMNLLVLVLAFLVTLVSVYLLSFLRAETFNQLRILGAPTSCVRQTLFGIVMMIIVPSIVSGLLLGWVEAQICAEFLTTKTGILMVPELGSEELILTLTALAIGIGCAWVQCSLITRKKLH